MPLFKGTNVLCYAYSYLIVLCDHIYHLAKHKKNVVRWFRMESILAFLSIKQKTTNNRNSGYPALERLILKPE